MGNAESAEYPTIMRHAAANMVVLKKLIAPPLIMLVS
jgi:hypothetical protein